MTKYIRIILFASCFVPSRILHAAPVDYEKVFFKNRDTTRLYACYRAPERNNPCLILLHGLASSKEEWLGFGQYLNRKGWGWLAYDARGHGESSLTQGVDGSPNGYKYFGIPGKGSDWEKMIDDLGAAMNYLEREKGVKRNQIQLVGASLGANVALNYAVLSRFEGKVVLLSPGLSYQEVKMEKVIERYPGRKILLVAHPGDSYAFSSCTLMKQSFPTLTFWSDVKGGHGVQMMDSNLADRTVDWVRGKK